MHTRYFSVFSGVGGFELGIERAYGGVVNRHKTSANQQESREMVQGDDVHSDKQLLQGTPTCVGFSEIDKHASAVLKRKFPNVPNHGDITKIDWSLVPDFDLLVGGSPCQDLSVAGKRAGLEGGRSGLFYEYVRCLKEKKPSCFIWENVKGVLSSNNGRDFGAVLSALAEEGYSLWWQVLNAKDFGVPQNRERVFVVGTRTDPRHSGEVFFDTSQTSRDPGILKTKYGRHQQDVFHDIDGILQCLQVGAHAQHSHLTKIDDKRLENKVPLGLRIRRLTPRECERLMSWPDDWTKFGDYGDGELKEISDSQRYKMCGNGVVSTVVTHVVKELILHEPLPQPS